MNTLTTAPLAPLLDRLFKEAEDTMEAAHAVIQAIPDEELERLQQSKTEYLDFYGRLKEMPLAVSRETGKLLYMLARSGKARAIVEFGTSFGISTLHLAAALRDNGGGILITSEFEPAKAAIARKNLTDAGLIGVVDIRIGDALLTLKRDLPEAIDLLLLDGAKSLYPEILNMLERRFRPGTLIITDDTDVCADFVAYLRDPVNGYLSVPFGGDVEVSMRLG